MPRRRQEVSERRGIPGVRRVAGPGSIRHRRWANRDTLNEASSDWPSSGVVIAPATAFFGRETRARSALVWLRGSDRAQGARERCRLRCRLSWGVTEVDEHGVTLFVPARRRPLPTVSTAAAAAQSAESGRCAGGLRRERGSLTYGLRNHGRSWRRSTSEQLRRHAQPTSFTSLGSPTGVQLKNTIHWSNCMLYRPCSQPWLSR